MASELARIARQGEGREGGLLIGELDGAPVADHPLAPFLLKAGFVRSGLGFQVPRATLASRPAREPAAQPAH